MLERRARYTPGGYHPIEIGDQLHNGRYRIIHRLGHGSFSTVWLAVNQHYDDAAQPNSPGSRYVAVKIAVASSKNNEAATLRRLQAGTGSPFVVSMLDEFEITGPNGTHRCIVTELLGPSVMALKMCDESDTDELEWQLLPLPMGRRLAVQAAKAVAFIHSHRIVHAGRLSPACLQERFVDCWHRSSHGQSGIRSVC
jgi:serine/threonine-protein kinase SRPK3